MNSSKEFPAQKKLIRIEEIQNVPHAKVEQVINDYKWSGGEATPTPQLNGEYKVTVKFFERARYPVSGEAIPPPG